MEEGSWRRGRQREGDTNPRTAAVKPDGEDGARPSRGTWDSGAGRRGRGWGRGRGRGARPKTSWGPDRPARGAGESQPRALDYAALEALSEQPPSEVAISLSSNPAFRRLLGQSEVEQDLGRLVCSALSKAFGSRAARGSIQHLAAVVKDSGFLRSVLQQYVVDMSSEANAARSDEYPQDLDNILAVLSKVLSIFPASSVQVVAVLTVLLRASIAGLRAAGLHVRPETEESLEAIQSSVDHLQKSSREGTLPSDRGPRPVLRHQDDNPGADRLEDFRTIPIYPTTEEFHQDERPYLRPNLAAGQYASVHLYLDTHFRLLREDFVRPLREGIQQVMASSGNDVRDEEQLKRRRFDNLSVYFDTKLVTPVCTRSGVAHVVEFDPRPLKFVRWENSKRLLYGSLVCLSCDRFESNLFATISERDANDLKKGRVQIMFSEESRVQLAALEPDQLFLMVETTAYFEAYRHVLKGLQEVEEEEFPFQRYIVEGIRDVRPPTYLRGEDRYDLSSMDALSSVTTGHGEDDLEDEDDEDDLEERGRMQPFHCLQPDDWPSKEQLNLDESQMRAFQLALTKELAIIQGPPGTGKTYVGLKIAQALLMNKKLWTVDGDGPMLVVCYTNHALDQFLEGIHGFLKRGIVRVGGRSTNELLKQFSLQRQLESYRFGRRERNNLQCAFEEISSELRSEEAVIKKVSVQLQTSCRGVLKEDFLEGFISQRHWDSLMNPPVSQHQGFQSYFEKKASQMIEWLGLGSRAFQQMAPEELNEETEAEDIAGVEEELVAVAEEADLIQAERFVEDAFERREKRKEMEEDMEEAVREAEERMLSLTVGKDRVQAEQGGQEWEVQRNQRKKMKRKIQKELEKKSDMTAAEEDATLDIWTMCLPDRWRLYRLWAWRYRASLQTKSTTSQQAYQDAVERLDEVRRNETISLLKNAKVIGMTTTGAAKFQKTLQEVRPRLVIIEEAAEVLEAHAVTSLNPDCQHLILIGDHQQLRPSANVYDLAKHHSLEVSLFERLVKMEFPYVRLDYQHRMRPDIARLLTPHIYHELENHPSVMQYDNIKGLNTNLFFLEHDHLEEEIRDGKSHQNQHEAMFVVSLCRYLLLQEYSAEQITILTTYSGQLHCLRKLMPSSEFSGVKVHVVDKYQGEENDIVLLSLVRSNKEGKVGFLSTANRVCVALSRAKKGLYCIGNGAMLSQVKLWRNIFQTLGEKGQVGKALTLCCQNHPENQARVACAEDFQQVPEGGCTTPCEFRLDCGHVCARACHPYDPEHKAYKCGKKCEVVLCDLGHRCPQVCHEPCPKCQVKIERVLSKCGHRQMVPCHLDPERFKCKEPCEKSLQCGHPCDSCCGDPCARKCTVNVPLTLECGHGQINHCFYKTNDCEPDCQTQCRQQLKCGHGCTGDCHGCHQGRNHCPCSQQCERLLICSHKCREPCSRDCPPCQLPCENVCVHSKCKRRCGQACAPCAEPCAWQCPHQSCSKLCHEPCDRPPCARPCSGTLPCGHPCIGLCGDRCPDKCRVCDHDEVTEIFFGSEDDPEASFIQLEDCGHIVESTAMDKYMETEQPTDGSEQMAIKLKDCPKCCTPIRRNLRYGSHINRSLAEIERVKEKINGNQVNIKGQARVLERKLRMNLTLLLRLPLEYQFIQESLRSPHLTSGDLLVAENMVVFVERVGKLLDVHNMGRFVGVGSGYKDRVDEFLKCLINKRQRFTEQQVSDLQRELERLTLWAELSAGGRTAKAQRLDVQAEVDAATTVLEKSGPFTEQDAADVKQALKDLKDKLPPSGLGISDNEREMIVSALKMPRGHWYKCPNGHVYVITECGGAMESRRCPDCDATIGGERHALASGNQVATEMDGAQHPAWSEANNLMNYDRF